MLQAISETIKLCRNHKITCVQKGKLLFENNITYKS